MYQTVSFSMFVDAFRSMERYNQFAAYYEDGKPVGAYDALRVLFDYLEDCDDNVELDVIALCCEFSHDTWSEIADQFGLACINLRDMTQDECVDAIREYLEDRGVLVGETDCGFVYRQH
jgi:hypothetical protein